MTQSDADRAQRLQDLRNRILANESVEPDEYAQVIADLRAGRLAAAAPPVRSRKTSTPIIASNDPLPGLED